MKNYTVSSGYTPRQKNRNCTHISKVIAISIFEGAAVFTLVLFPVQQCIFFPGGFNILNINMCWGKGGYPINPSLTHSQIQNMGESHQSLLTLNEGGFYGNKGVEGNTS